MDKAISVLVFPAGEINSVELHDALSTCVNIKLFGGSSVERHGSYIFKNYISDIPLIDDPTFLDKFNQIIHKHSIDIIFPTHDSVTTYFAKNKGQIDAKILTSDEETAEVCRDKEKTYKLFSDYDFVPHLYKEKKDVKYPVFIKPKIGAGSVGAIRISTPHELESISFQNNIVSEYLEGEEYTVDCLTDKKGKLAVISPRSRDRTLAGVSVSGEAKPLTGEIEIIANTINDKLTFTGLWFFQIKKDSTGKFKLLEISTRCAGTMCLTRAKGINLPLLSIYVALGYDIEILQNSYNVKMDRTLISRYEIDYEYDTVYLDFDDTVIIDDKVNLFLVMFIYQCKNAGKKVCLITKHANILNDTFAKHSISDHLFEEIIHLEANENKVDHINPERAVFIDNAFQERKLVHEKFNIPVFDVDGIEVLLDWRT